MSYNNDDADAVPTPAEMTRLRRAHEEAEEQRALAAALPAAYLRAVKRLLATAPRARDGTLTVTTYQIVGESNIVTTPAMAAALRHAYARKGWSVAIDGETLTFRQADLYNADDDGPRDSK